MPATRASRPGGIVCGQDIYSGSAEPITFLGDCIQDGTRKFRYAKMGGSTAGVTATMYAGPADVDNHKEVVQTGFTAEIGQTKDVQVALTGTAPTANQYDDGWLLVNKGTGLSQMRQIKSHDDGTAPCKVQLYSGFNVASAETSEMTLVASPYRAVVAIPTTRIMTAVGVCLFICSVNEYLWLQTRGYAPVVVDTGESLVLGEPAGYPASPAVDGACGPVAADTDEAWGTCAVVGAAAEPCVLDLKLE